MNFKIWYSAELLLRIWCPHPSSLLHLYCTVLHLYCTASVLYCTVLYCTAPVQCLAAQVEVALEMDLVSVLHVGGGLQLQHLQAQAHCNTIYILIYNPSQLWAFELIKYYDLLSVLDICLSKTLHFKMMATIDLSFQLIPI